MNSSPGTTPPAAGSHAHLRVLLVDDVAMNRRVAELFLKHLGCTVVSTEDVAAAIAQIRAQQFDMVFTDVEMPEINSIEAIAIHESGCVCRGTEEVWLRGGGSEGHLEVHAIRTDRAPEAQASLEF